MEASRTPELREKFFSRKDVAAVRFLHGGNEQGFVGSAELEPLGALGGEDRDDSALRELVSM